MFNKVEVFGEVPLARFGHTITQGKAKYLILNHLGSNNFMFLCSLKVESGHFRRSYGRHWQVHYHW